MRKAEAMRIINNTLKNKFNKENFKELSSNLFTNLNFKNERPIQSQNIVKSFRDGINSYEKIADFKNNGKEISVLTVELKKETSLDRARTMQRNFVAHHLDNTDTGRIIDAALVAFYHKNLDYWRLSFVKLDKKLKFDQENGGVNIAKELTPAKRYSFLVGEEEPTHTAEQQLLPLLKKETMPTLENIEEAFKIEKVTEEFFDKYKNHFIDLKEELEELVKKDQKIKKEFAYQNIHIVNFAKRIMSQLVFLYFIQKKGWLGVSKNKFWGSGPRNFMRKLFEKDIANYDNFFNDILEPLFYEGLAIKRENDFYSKLNCKIPFLNGGLFEPLKNYDWKETDILLDNEVFKNILDTFDLYNFTVREDEPLEKEVAVDPEMLGHVFEKLLDVEDRKAKGAFYTPREIVHYMCQESIINHIKTELKGIKKENIEGLIKFGDLAIENDKAKIKGENNIDYKMPKEIRDNAKEIDNILKDIKVCDPAIGSGAFPVGIMKEIVKTRKVLGNYIKEFNRNSYELKRHAIQESIYGVDIDSGAVDIAKLRLWLSLVVDEDDIDNIKPLPNLDYKIMQGNSLVDEFMGINLDYEFDKHQKDYIKKDKEKKLKSEFEYTNRILVDKEHKMNELINDLNVANDLYLKASNRKDKKILKNRINDRITEIFEEELKEQREEYFKELERIDKQAERLNDNSDSFRDKEINKLNKKFDFDLDKVESQFKEYTTGNKEKPFFLWKVYFADVFKNNGGFDIIIANPPYVGEKGNKEIFQDIHSSSLGKYYQTKMDLFYFFFHLSINIATKNGTINFITTNYFLTADGAKKLRKDFKDRTTVKKMINFNELKIFSSAKGQHNIITLLSKTKKKNYISENCITMRKGEGNPNIIQKIVNGRDKKTNYYEVSQKNLFESKENYIRIRGLYKDPLQRILSKMKNNTKKLGDICNINQGLRTGADRATNRYINKYNLDVENGKGIFVLTKEEYEELSKKLTDFEKDRFLPLFKNSDIYRYYTSKNSDYYFLNLACPRDKNIEPNKIKNIIEYLKPFKPVLSNRNETANGVMKAINEGIWWLISVRRKLDFKQEKIVCPQRSKTNVFGYNNTNWNSSADVYYITKKENTNLELKYILTILNSKLIYTWLYSRGKRKGNTLELYKTPLTQIPIPVISSKTQKKFVDIADIIIDKSKRLYKNKKRDINKLINNYNFETVKTLNNVITNNYKKIYKGRAKKVGEMKVDLKNDWAIIHSNDRELFKFKIENEHKAEYLKLYLESLSDEKIAKIDDRTGKIIEKVLSIEIPGYNEDHKIKSLIEEWRQIKEEIDFLEKKVVEIDKEIDQMVYDLYDLTQEEIDIVENNSN